MLAGMSSAELTYWELKYDEELLGDERADYNAAKIAATIINWAGQTLAEHAEPRTPFDLMPKWRRAEDDAAAAAPDVVDQDLLSFKLDHAFAAIAGSQQAKAEREAAAAAAAAKPTDPNPDPGEPSP